MNINLEELQLIAELTEQIKNNLQVIEPQLQTIERLNLENVLLAPADRLIHAGEASKLLGVNQNTIGSFIKKGLLTPLYVNSNRRKFWLSEVLALPKKTTKAFTASGDDNNKQR